MSVERKTGFGGLKRKAPNAKEKKEDYHQRT